MLLPKKSNHSLARKHYYLNYGILSIATSLNRSGYDVLVVHGLFEDPISFANSLDARDFLGKRHPIFLSIPSGFAISWAKSFCCRLKQLNPRQRIILGGRWVIGADGDWIRERIPNADLAVYGTAEGRSKRLLNEADWWQIPGTTASRSPLSIDDEPLFEEVDELDYSLLDNVSSFQPSIEVSRGCGMGCAFCLERTSPLTILKDPSRIAEAILHLKQKQYRGSITPYFECSFFRPTLHWAQALGNAFRSRGIFPSWRTETRVDGISPKVLAGLARSGLKVLDLGLESASFQQLLAMKKTTSPKAYLRKGSELLRCCKEEGIWPKVNILLYSGECFSSLAETTNWLGDHADCIKGISVNPLIWYRLGSHADNISDLEATGGHLADEECYLQYGYSNVHLSNEIDADGAAALAIELSRQFMNSKDYYDLKKFSYFPRDFEYYDFVSLVGTENPDLLPFGQGDSRNQRGYRESGISSVPTLHKSISTSD